MSPSTPGAFDETHDVYDPLTFTTTSLQPQLHDTSNPAPTSLDPLLLRRSSTLSSRSLRRVPRQSEIRSRPQYRTVSAEHPHQYHSNSQAVESIPVAVQPAPDPSGGIAALRPALSEAQTESDRSTPRNSLPSFGNSYWPRRSTSVSPRTASAILFALEEGLRKPLPFTTDWEEVNASMSDLVGVGGSPGYTGNVRTQNGTSRGPVPVSTHPPSGVRTPTDIMRQRRDREARKKAEQEARDREQEETRRRQQEQEQQPYAAGVADDRHSQRRTTLSRPPDLQQDIRTSNPPSAFPQKTSMPANGRRPEYQSQQIPMTGPAQQSTIPPNQQAPGQPQAVSATGLQAAPKQQSQVPPSQLGAPQSQQQLKRAPFPHAFERWENLSSHWEGLTGYWIRKLEQNNEALEKDPISQQMARQVTDLSAAGANLFHAVVELQRLRASSERKFQRWFFDTRSELERAKEVQGDLERQVKTERQARTETMASMQKAESDKTRAEDMLKEMRRELQISKDEARRAWEELGRREQEERDRTNSLRNGEPTLVGGVQVVPMIQGLPSRHNSMTRPQTRTGPYPGGPGPTSMGGEGQAQNPTTGGQYYEEQPESPTVTDPFTEGRRQAASTAVESPSQPAGHFYEPEEPGLGMYPPATEPDDRSHGPSAPSSEPGEDEFSQYHRDPQGRLVYPRSMSEASDEYDHDLVDDNGHFVSEPATSAPLYGGYTSTSVDYSGSGWGPGTGWESVTPRHHHPTRLSDVIEEDEPSRTSASRASHHSRGF